MQQAPQSLDTLLREGTLYRVGARRAFLEGLYTVAIESFDGITHSLVIATEATSDVGGSLTA